MPKSYIKKIKLSYIEGWINKRLKRNIISIGWDVSMHNTGIAIIRTTDTYLVLELTHKMTVPKKTSLLDGVDLFVEQLEDFKRKVSQRYKLDKSIIEDCFFGSNVKTLKCLARFSILIYDRFKNLTKNSILVLPMSARSKIGFKKSHKGIKGKYLKKEILAYINSLLQTKIKDDDIGDAIVLAIGGLIE
jgi:Holliday junction resolvasome RuvABC endonuclease subunit